MSLERYNEMRDFERTPEPPGETRRGTGRSFVVQKHAARRLHYDFRLELDGVLLSWAVPKGPSLDPGDKRLAVHTEDHPLDYGGFEGVIPKGEYGAGSVVVWDRGTWEPIGDPREGHRKGRLKFRLHGEKLRGVWNLFRTRRDGDQDHWMLVKSDDDEADRERDLVAEQPRSVLTGRSIEEVARDADRLWDRRGERAPDQARPAGPDAREIPGAKRAALPASLAPQLATLAKEAPDGDDWLHEIKYDGYRLLARIEGGRAVLWTRNGNDWTSSFAPIAAALGSLPCESAWIDGEAVVQRADGTTDFQALQNDLGAGRTDRMLFYAFDLVWLDGQDLRKVPLERRKEALAALLEAAPSGPVRFSDHVVGNGPTFFAHACRLALEGIVSKRRSAPYRGARTPDWQKVKCLCRDEVVVGGFTPPSGSRKGFASLLVGQWEDGRLRYLGRVGTGFTERSLKEAHERLTALATDGSPFEGAVPNAKGATWVRPELVATVEYTELTRDGVLRHPSFKGFRDDVPAEQVTRIACGSGVEEAAPPDEVKRYRARDGSERAVVAGVDLSNPDRQLYGEIGITKVELARYYEANAELALPHLADRPLTLVRCPTGIGEGPDIDRRRCFYQKHVKEALPDGVGQVLVAEKEGKAPYYTIHNLKGLIALVQMGVLEIHPWGARIDRPDRPDRLFFDLDPDPGLPHDRLVQAVLDVKAVLDELDLVSFLKTTGGKGYHVVVPIDRRIDWDEARAFTHDVARVVASRDPSRYTTNMAKARRHGRVYIDTLRNAYGATAVGAWSTRARPNAPISCPIGWDELVATRPDQFTVRNIARRLATLGRDPWEGFSDVHQAITAGRRREVST